MKPDQYINELEDLVKQKLEEVAQLKNEVTKNQQFDFAYQYRLLEQKLGNLLLDLDLINNYDFS